jgi:hypothetical protein
MGQFGRSLRKQDQELFDELFECVRRESTEKTEITERAEKPWLRVLPSVPLAFLPQRHIVNTERRDQRYIGCRAELDAHGLAGEAGQVKRAAQGVGVRRRHLVQVAEGRQSR